MTTANRIVECQDCGIKIHPEAGHTGREKWCEDCFEAGLCEDMDDHFRFWVANEMATERCADD